MYINVPYFFLTMELSVLLVELELEFVEKRNRSLNYFCKIPRLDERERTPIK
jgi:hypothetical protein